MMGLMKSVLAVLLGYSILFGSLALAEQPQRMVAVALIDKPWAVALDITGYTIRLDGVLADGRRYFLAEDTETAITVSITLGSARGQDTAQGCPTRLQQIAQASTGRSGLPLTQHDVPKMSVIEYSDPGASGSNGGQFHLFACTGKDDVLTDIHISKTGFRSGNETVLRGILDTLDFVPAPAASSLDHFRAGSAPYLQGRYALAIPYYEQALALEQSNPALDKGLWRLLVHNLGTAYRMTGDLPQARNIFEYGLTQDLANPLFHYLLAQIYAGLNDREHAMQSLHAAFHNRATRGSESLPDPRQDGSFRRFMLDPSFRHLAESLMQPAI